MKNKTYIKDEASGCEIVFFYVQSLKWATKTLFVISSVRMFLVMQKYLLCSLNHYWFVKFFFFNIASINVIIHSKFKDISIEIHIFSLKKIHFNMSSGKWRPFCLGLDVLIQISRYTLGVTQQNLIKVTHCGEMGTRIKIWTSECLINAWHIVRQFVSPVVLFLKAEQLNCQIYIFFNIYFFQNNCLDEMKF